MTPDTPNPTSRNPDGTTNPQAENAFVQQALHAADKSERKFTISVWTLCALTVVATVWMHLNLRAPQSLGELLHTMLRLSVVFIVLLLAVMEYLRQAMNRNTRTVLRALANTRPR